MNNKKPHPAVSKHFSEIATKGWEKRRKKIIAKEKLKVEAESIKKYGVDVN